MLTYPSIPKTISSTPIWAFDKLDGSNIRVEWTPKTGFNKFGTRHKLLAPDEPILGEAIQLFQETLADPLAPIMTKLRNQRVTLFMEFLGESSFAGNHKADEPHKLVLFDASLYKKGFLLPGEFTKIFEDKVETPGILYTGRPTKEFQEEVRTGRLENMTFEGVVCKSNELVRGRAPVFKVKNQAWLDKLKSFTKEDAELFKRLS